MPTESLLEFEFQADNGDRYTHRTWYTDSAQARIAFIKEVAMAVWNRYSFTLDAERRQEGKETSMTHPNTACPGTVVHIVCNELREVRGVYETYAKACAFIDAVIREDGCSEGTPAWQQQHDRWNILQRVVQ